MGLTRHTTAMDLMIEFLGDRVVPRQGFGPSSQLFVGASLKQGAETFMSNNMAMGTEYNTRAWSEFTILARTTDQSGMSQHGARNVI